MPVPTDATPLDSTGCDWPRPAPPGGIYAITAEQIHKRAIDRIDARMREAMKCVAEGDSGGAELAICGALACLRFVRGAKS